MPLTFQQFTAARNQHIQSHSHLPSLASSATANMETKESLNNSQAADSQVEDADGPIQHGTAIISYDSNGLGGIVRSPYVLGAAALASFGGFSFGYGMQQ